MNKLLNSSSPYIRSHANDLTKWYLWEEETFEIAREEDKPILVSIGYFACHWCHVMQYESFNNPEIADYLNTHFIPIKVDREQQPDIDALYIEFVTATTGNAGWPLNVFITPEKIPFFGGTYFPPIPKYGRISFLQLLQNINEIYQREKKTIVEKNINIFNLLFNSAKSTINTKEINEFDFDYSNYILLNLHDKEFGGFGNSIKFPHYTTYEYLINYYKKTNNNKILEIVLNSLEKMTNGGFYDLIDSGFHRYSTDREWIIPHFEKMLYDNIEMINLYTKAFNLTRNTKFLDIATETHNFIEDFLSNGENLYYTSIDADHNHIEGEYYLFTKEDFKNCIPDNLEHYFNEFFTPIEFENKYILTKNFFYPEKSNPKYKFAKELLFLLKNYRIQNKPKHNIDTKLLTNNNSNYITALINLFYATLEEAYLKRAINLFDVITKLAFQNKKLLHEIKSSQQIFGYLDDYAAYIEACISLFIATGKLKFYQKAKFYVNYVINNFYDAKSNNLYYCETKYNNFNPIIYQDTPIKSPVAKFLESTIYLANFENNIIYKEISEILISKYFKTAKNNPIQYAGLLNATFKNLYSTHQLVILFPFKTTAEKYHSTIKQFFSKNCILIPILQENKECLEIYKDKEIFNNNITFYLCKDFTCYQPTNDINLILDMI